MNPPTRTPEGQPHRCPVCGKQVVIEPSQPAGDAPCPHCGSLLWFVKTDGLEKAQGFRKFSITDPSIRTKAQALTAIIDRLIESGALAREHREEVLAAILLREELGSTGIGRGVAVANAKVLGIENVAAAMTEFRAGVDFESLDGEPVRLVFLIVSPANRPGDHLRVLEAVSRQLRN